MSTDKNDEVVIEETQDADEDLQSTLAAKDEEIAKLQANISRLNKQKKSLKEKVSQEPEPQDTPTETPKESNFEYLMIRDKGYSPEEATYIMNNGGLEKIDSDPYLKRAMELQRQEAKADQAADISISPKSDGGKAVTVDDLKGMSSEDMEKYIPKG